MSRESKINFSDIPAKMSVEGYSMTGHLKDFSKVSVQIAGNSLWEPLWDEFVRKYHYLGYQNLLGHRIKYLAFIDGSPVAALSFSAPTLKLKCRDLFIGWNITQRKHFLNRIVCNSRFLILPWVSIPNLASHLLSKTANQLKKDWELKFGTKLFLIETFIDGQHFDGASYKAANWIHVGRTYGSGKQGIGYIYHGNKKEVYLYVLDPKFRDIIDCAQKSTFFYHRPPPTQKKVEDLKMLLPHTKWHSGLTADLCMDEEDILKMSEDLVKFHEQFFGYYGRIEHQRLAMTYLSGLISNADAKSVEPIALELLDKKAVRSLQRFMKDYQWDHDGMLITHQQLLSEQISRPNGMINVDSSEFAKKGKESVGVARQYCGEMGKTENCQSGVFVGYSSDAGYGLLNCRLYMPKVWFTKEYEQRCRYNKVPEDLTFKTKLQIALDLIHQVKESNKFEAKWMGCDATFGSDIEFLSAIPEDLYYFAQIKSITQVFTKKPKTGVPEYSGRGRRPNKVKILPGQPQPKKVSDIAKSKRLKWIPVVLAEGAKGPICAEVARIRIYLSRDGLPIGDEQWLFMRKDPDGQIKYALSNAPKRIKFSELVEASIMRWPIEQCFQDGKSYLGMGQYEHRSWPAWHRHMLFVFLAQHFLLKTRLSFKKKVLC